MTLALLMCLGRGSSTRMPWTLASALSFLTSATTSASGVSLASSVTSTTTPIFSPVVTLLRAYQTLPGSSPTSTTESLGVKPFALSASISFLISAWISWAMGAPLMIFAAMTPPFGWGK